MNTSETAQPVKEDTTGWSLVLDWNRTEDIRYNGYEIELLYIGNEVVLFKFKNGVTEESRAKRHSLFRQKSPYSVPNHIPGFRTLADGEAWRLPEKFRREDLRDGERPLLEGEKVGRGDEVFLKCDNIWLLSGIPGCSAYGVNLYRTRRPLPELPEKEDDEWISVKERLPETPQRVIARYVGVYDSRNVYFWRDGGDNPHFGVIGESDGKGSQPATHWKPLPDEAKRISEQSDKPVKEPKRETCGVCAGPLVYIRPAVPYGDRRKVCPACLADRLLQIQDISSPHYGVVCANEVKKEARP